MYIIVKHDEGVNSYYLNHFEKFVVVDSDEKTQSYSVDVYIGNEEPDRLKFSSTGYNKKEFVEWLDKRVKKSSWE